MKSISKKISFSFIKIRYVFFITLLAGLTLFQSCQKEDMTDHDHSSTPSAKYIALNNAMRQLWADHMQWTYGTVDAFFHQNDQLQPRLTRLLQNQKDLGAALVPYYGQQAGDALAALLTTHIEQAVPVLTAAKANDQPGLDKALADWYANAKDIADFLTNANPQNWPATATEPMMKEHISTTVTYAVDLLKGDYTQSIIDYDKAFDHMMMMADVLSDGIANQFPDKF